MMKSKEVEVAGPPMIGAGGLCCRYVSARWLTLGWHRGWRTLSMHDGLWDHFAKNRTFGTLYWSVIENSEGVIYAGTGEADCIRTRRADSRKLLIAKRAVQISRRSLRARSWSLARNQSGLMRYSDGKISSVAAASAIPDVRAIAEAPTALFGSAAMAQGLVAALTVKPKYSKLDGLP